MRLGQKTLFARNITESSNQDVRAPSCLDSNRCANGPSRTYYLGAMLTLTMLIAPSRDADPEFDTVSLVRNNRRLAKTNDGRLALVLGIAEVGDEVVVLLKGGKVPYVPRGRGPKVATYMESCTARPLKEHGSHEFALA